jgi:hypothetical protein
MPNPNQMTNSGASTIVGIFCERISNGYNESFKNGIKYKRMAVKSPMHVPIRNPIKLKLTVETRCTVKSLQLKIASLKIFDGAGRSHSGITIIFTITSHEMNKRRRTNKDLQPFEKKVFISDISPLNPP